VRWLKAAGPEHHDIPAGHAGSDMRAISCNIGLNRRRDLSLRSDLRLHSSEESFNLRDVFRVRLIPATPTDFTAHADPFVLICFCLGSQVPCIRLKTKQTCSLKPDKAWRFQGKLVVMLGVPDMGKVCTTCHVPNYVDTAQELRERGVDDIVCVAVAPAKDAAAWGQKIDLKDSKVCCT